MTDKITYGRHQIDNSDIEAVIHVLRSETITQGPVATRFEQEIAKITQSRYCISVSSATAALHIACLALNTGPGDLVWTSPNSFIASANCALFCGAKIDFVDIDPQTYNMCPVKLEKKLAAAKKANALPKIVIPVHFAGQPCDMEKIHQLSKQYGFAIIEDASHAIGSTFNKKPTGNCAYSDITVFSFHPVKIITSGEGGAATTNQKILADKMRQLANQGITRNENSFQFTNEGPWYYEQHVLGYNYRISDIHAALGLSQLNKLPIFLQSRQKIKEFYHQRLATMPIVRPYQNTNSISSYHLYPILLNTNKADYKRKVFEQLHSAGIYVQSHYIPIHTQPFFRAKGFRKGDYPITEAYYSKTISLPIHPGLTLDDLEYIVDTLKRVLNHD